MNYPRQMRETELRTYLHAEGFRPVCFKDGLRLDAALYVLDSDALSGCNGASNIAFVEGQLELQDTPDRHKKMIQTGPSEYYVVFSGGHVKLVSKSQHIGRTRHIVPDNLFYPW